MVRAVIAARALHVDHLVDADDLGLQRLATVASSTSAEAPGYLVVTSTWGGTISGSCATRIRVRARSPPSVMTIAMTIASRGRSMND